MRDEELDNKAVESISSLMPRVVPNPRFVQDLEGEIARAARRAMRYGADTRTYASFEDVVIELRKLIRLLRKTLVPVQPQMEFVRTLGNQLQVRAAERMMARRRRWQWLMVGGVVGSALSLLGLVAAFLLRRRNGHVHCEESARVA